MITVYNFTTPGSYPFVNFGWVGFIGVVSAFGEKLGMGMKVWRPFNESIASPFGDPWTYLLREVM